MFQCLIFIDDLAIPNKDKCGSQPPLELVRQWMDHKHWSDLKDTSKLELIDLVRYSETIEYHIESVKIKNL